MRGIKRVKRGYTYFLFYPEPIRRRKSQIQVDRLCSESFFLFHLYAEGSVIFSLSTHGFLLVMVTDLGPGVVLEHSAAFSWSSSSPACLDGYVFLRAVSRGNKEKGFILPLCMGKIMGQCADTATGVERSGNDQKRFNQCHFVRIKLQVNTGKAKEEGGLVLTVKSQFKGVFI